MSMSFTAVAVPETSRATMANPFMDAVKGMIPDEAWDTANPTRVDDTKREWVPTGALTFTVDDVSATEKKGTTDVVIFNRLMRQLTEAGDKFNVTVRRQPAAGEVDTTKKASAVVTFYPVPKIKRLKGDTTDPEIGADGTDEDEALADESADA